MRAQWRFWLTVALLAGTALLLQARNRTEVIPARPPLATFPHTLGSWNSVDLTLSQDVLDTLGPGDFLVRDYQNSANNSQVDLFIAYFPSQRSGDAIHSPKNCLPGAGWSPVRADRIVLQIPGQAEIPANRYLIAKAEQRQLVLYWYWAHNRAVASEYAAKFYLVTDSIRQHRTDGSMIRITTPLADKESLDSAQQRLETFAGNIVPLINNYIPR